MISKCLYLLFMWRQFSVCLFVLFCCFLFEGIGVKSIEFDRAHQHDSTNHVMYIPLTQLSFYMRIYIPFMKCSF